MRYHYETIFELNIKENFTSMKSCIIFLATVDSIHILCAFEMFQTNFDKENKIWSGIKTPPLFNSKISVGQVILRALTTHGSKTAQV